MAQLQNYFCYHATLPQIIAEARVLWGICPDFAALPWRHLRHASRRHIYVGAAYVRLQHTSLILWRRAAERWRRCAVDRITAILFHRPIDNLHSRRPMSFANQRYIYKEALLKRRAGGVPSDRWHMPNHLRISLCMSVFNFEIRDISAMSPIPRLWL